MAMRLTHVLDEQTHEDGVRLLSLLLQLMPAGRVEQRVIVMGRTPATLRPPPGVEVSRIARRFNWPLAGGPDLRRMLGRHRPDLVHGWGADAAAVAAAVRPGQCPMVTTISDPADAGRSGRWWPGTAAGRNQATGHKTGAAENLPREQEKALVPRTAGRAGGAGDVLCSSRLVQRRLVQSGIPLEATTVIRPGVDSAAIGRAKQTFRRSDLGLPPEGRVLLTASPPSRAGGQYYAIWAAAILHQVWPDACLVVPGTSREQRRLARFVERIYCPQIYFFTGDRYSPAELLAVSDMLVVPAVDDVPTAWLAWAMSASVPIVGSAVPAVTELITDRQNGFLCEPGAPQTLATGIRSAAESGDTARQCVEAARTQARELFSARPCVDRYLEVIERSDRPLY